MDGCEHPPGFRFRSLSRTHCGGRPLNEDRVLDRPDLGFWAVADGMGGHQNGDVAAARLVEGLSAIDHEASGYSRLNAVISRIDEVNAGLFQGRDGLAAGGATLVVLLAHEDHYACLWAGDSRGYLLRDGQLVRLTHDHSLVQSLVDEGLISEAERRRHPEGHVVTRAVGAAAQVVLEQRFAPIHDQDRFLLCSDGLNACIDDEEIAEILQHHQAARAADRLLALALEREVQDNVSFVLVEAQNVQARMGSAC